MNLEEINKSLKTTDIKGKEYVEVNERVKAFRKLYPDGFINTEMVSNENGVCIFKCLIGIYRNDGIDWLATGHAYEKENSSFINKTSYIENCETSAVGRALGMLGIGIGTSIASAEEVGNAIIQQEQTTKITKQNENVKEFNISTISTTMEKALKDGIKANGIANEVVISELKKLGHSKLNELELVELMNFKKAIGVE